MKAARVTIAAILVLGPALAAAADYVAMSGKELYDRFCASCHGVEGRGDGPVASSLSVEVPDLTLVARRAGDLYPRERIVRIIDGRHIIGAHGSRTMPVWGEDLNRIELGNPNAERATRIIIDRLADYVWLLQKPAREGTR
jgi:mono/diheme cytochrome c family protein